MSIPVCFVFKLQRVLCRSDACFTKGNVQRSHEFMTGDDNFDTLDFDAIYHDSRTDATNQAYIHDCRMAEVAVKGQLNLADALQAILFRTNWDLETFRYLLSVKNVPCPHRMAREQVQGSLFVNQGLFLTDLNFNDDQIQLQFHFPLRYQPNDKSYDVCVVQDCSDGRKRLDKKVILDKPSLTINKYWPNADALWTIHLEKELAFQGRLQHAKSELFG